MNYVLNDVINLHLNYFFNKIKLIVDVIDSRYTNEEVQTTFRQLNDMSPIKFNRSHKC